MDAMATRDLQELFALHLQGLLDSGYLEGCRTLRDARHRAAAKRALAAAEELHEVVTTLARAVRPP
jgi:hypothetical protein